jgi:flavin-binding protein dodecin
MFKMLEVVESSEVSYSDAVKKAIDGLKAKGSKVHFFELVEQRGALRPDNIEYQVKVKAAVEY